MEIQGFKSFPDRTRLSFIDGITAVVGPNGSGKSNIADAVRWVLGEQSSKNLRGGKMEDVIFGGTQTRKAQGFAYVQITIDNSDRALPYNNEEVSISRKLYRSGESEYQINHVNVRLKDIYELFMDTGLGRDGYSIIGQGKISEIVSAKSTQRREIFEEAAGISKYRYRKAEAERRLGAAEENLLRLHDILSELENRIEPLRIQSEKASQFLEYAGEKRTLEISLWVLTLEKSKQVLREQEDKILLCKSQHEDIQSKLDEVEKKITSLYTDMQNISMDIEKKRNQIKDIETTSSQRVAQIAVMHNDIEHNKASIDRIRDELNESGASDEQLNQKISTYKQEIADKEQKHQTFTIQQAETQKELENLNAQQKDIQLHISSLKERRFTLSQNINEIKLVSASRGSLIEESTTRLQDLEENVAIKDENIKKLEIEKNDCKELISEIEQKIVSLQNEKKGFELKIESRQSKVDTLAAKKRKLEDEIQKHLQKAELLLNMENSLDGFHNSVKFVMSQARKETLAGVYGPVSRLIEVDDQNALAVEIALGGALQNIVVENESIAKSAIAMLKNARSGRATFLPISSVKGNKLTDNQLSSAEGFVGFASNLVRCKEKFGGIIRQLLGRIIIVQDLDCAVQLAKKVNYRYRIVTLDGQVVNTGGSMTGGYTTKTAGILGRGHEIEHLKQQAQTMKKQVEELQFQIKIAEEQLSAVQASSLGVDGELVTAQEDKFQYVAELKQLNNAFDNAVQSKKKTVLEYEKLTARLKELKENDVSNSDKIDEFNRKLVETDSALNILDDKKNKLVSQITEITDQLSALKIKMVTLEQEISAIRQINEQLITQKSNQREHTIWMHSQIEKFSEQSKQLTQKIEQAKRDQEEYAEQIKTLNVQIKELTEKRNKCEGETTSLRGYEKEVTAQREVVAKDLSRLEEKKRTLQAQYDIIIARLWDEYEVTRSQAAQLANPIEDENLANRRLSELKAKIKSLGNVNVSAIEEYKEVSERYQFLKTQIEDVETSRAELNRMIASLTEDMHKIFLNNFDKISTNFSRIFTELFDGGKAELSLTDPQNVLESGIEIYVQPPGKIIKNLASLSGGEQAFVAIAIYFAILKVRPSPFCMLDEIEAALDDVNVVKYAHYLRTICDKTQFITITHRRGTMEEADILYGVTMQEEGVSKLLELNVNEIESKLGIK
ncbi:MAG: chromosome segregation protein SMC [Bacteroidaceae bacterium]|nr:chromosome segregation protein SMC [Bacteroidaceae bacterium]